jgi:hypothetical protein
MSNYLTGDFVIEQGLVETYVHIVPTLARWLL